MGRSAPSKGKSTTVKLGRARTGIEGGGLMAGLSVIYHQRAHARQTQARTEFLESMRQAVKRIAASLGDLRGQRLWRLGRARSDYRGAGCAGSACCGCGTGPRAGGASARAVPSRASDGGGSRMCCSFDFAAARRRRASGWLVVGNLPYCITSQILLKLAASHAALDRAVLMVQREVADRITAEPGLARLRAALSDGADVWAGREAFHAAAGVRSRRRRTCIPRSFAGGLRRALRNWAWKKSAFLPSSGKCLRKNARRWPIIFEQREFHLQRFQPRWPMLQSIPRRALKLCPSKHSRHSGTA